MSQELRGEFEIIRDEIEPGANTPERVGGALVRLNDEVDANKIELENKISQAELDRDNNKGIFGTLSLLQAKYPKADNMKDWYAFVGTTNPREKYLVEANGGDWKPTGDMQNVGNSNMADYAKKTELEPLAKKVRDDGLQVVYSLDGTTGIEPDMEWLIPSNMSGNRVAIGWLFIYENPEAIRGKSINTLQFNVSKVGSTTLVIVTGIPNALTIKKEININLPKIGSCDIQLPEDIVLGNNEYIGFDTRNKTGVFNINDAAKNPVAGGYYYYSAPSATSTLSPRNMAVGFGFSSGTAFVKKNEVVDITGTLHLGMFDSKESARNSVPNDYRKEGLSISYTLQGKTINETFNNQNITEWNNADSWGVFVKGEYKPTELIPFKGDGLIESRHLFFYENQTPIRGKEIDRIRINAKQAGTLGIYVCTNIEVGKNRVDISSFTLQITKGGDQILNFPEPIILKDDEWLGVGYGTAGFMVDLDSNNDIGKGYYYCNNTSKEVIALFQGRNLCVGVIEKGAKENLTIDGLSIKDDESPKKEGSVLEMNKHKIGDIYSLGKTVTSRLAPTKKTRLLTFMHLTDIHLNWKGLARALEFMNNDVPNGCDFAVNSGDTVINWGDDMTDYIKQVNSSRKNIYHCLGNHDVKSTDYEVHYKKFFEPMEQKLEYGNGRNLYYYKDLKGVRFIFLHDFDSGTWATSYGQAQIDWFINALKGCEYAIIVKHHPVYQIHGKNIIDGKGKPIEWYNDFFDYNTPTIAPTTYGENSGDPIIEIVEAWRNGTSLARTYHEVVVNVEFEQKGQFITYLCGHEHYDKFGYVGNTTQLMIVNNCTSMMDVYGDMPRIANTITQDVINYMNVSLDEKTLTVLRLGSDCAYTGRDRKKITVTWDKNKMINE